MTEINDPIEADDPPYFPTADPDAPDAPDHEGVGPEGEQLPDADPDSVENEDSDEVVF